MMYNNNVNENQWNMIPGNSSVKWTRYEDKLFENGLVLFPDDFPDRWQRIAEGIPGKTPEDIRLHYEDLVHDVEAIDAGRIELPNYKDNSSDWDSDSKTNQISFGSAKTRNGDVDRKKGTPWTEEEHR